MTEKKQDDPKAQAEKQTQVDNTSSSGTKSTTDAGAGMGNAKAQQEALKAQAAGDNPNGTDGSNEFADSSAAPNQRQSDIGKLDGTQKKGHEKVEAE